MKIYKLAVKETDIDGCKKDLEALKEVISSIDQITFSLSPEDKAHGCEMVWVDSDKFDSAFSQDRDLYVGPHATCNSIIGRYQRFIDFLKNNNSMNISSVHVTENGRVNFGNGRHRYSVLRDLGWEKIPVAMTPEAIKNAKKFSLI